MIERCRASMCAHYFPVPQSVFNGLPLISTALLSSIFSRDGRIQLCKCGSDPDSNLLTDPATPQYYQTSFYYTYAHFKTWYTDAHLMKWTSLNSLMSMCAYVRSVFQLFVHVLSPPQQLMLTTSSEQWTVKTLRVRLANHLQPVDVLLTRSLLTLFAYQ